MGEEAALVWFYVVVALVLSPILMLSACGCLLVAVLVVRSGPVERLADSRAVSAETPIGVRRLPSRLYATEVLC